MNKDSPIYIAGHNGMVGSAVLRELTSKGYSNLLFRGRTELDLTHQGEVDTFFKNRRPRAVVIAAAMVGGIIANNTLRGDFIARNLQIQTNLINASHHYEVEKLIFLGSSCIYPKETKQPIKEEALLTGPLEPTNEPYAVAKIAGIKLCEALHHQYNCNFYSLMPCNLYGINDNFNLKNSHVLPALIRKIHEAKINNQPQITVWGTGKPMREFLLVDDLAAVIEKCLQDVNAEDIYNKGISQLNVGTGKDITIRELTEEIMKVVGFKGKLVLDTSKPDGMMRKVMDVSRLKELKLHSPTPFTVGLKKTYQWYKEEGCQTSRN